MNVEPTRELDLTIEHDDLSGDYFKVVKINLKGKRTFAPITLTRLQMIKIFNYLEYDRIIIDTQDNDEIFFIADANLNMSFDELPEELKKKKELYKKINK